MVKLTIALDPKLFGLLKAIGIVHRVPFRDLIEETLLAALLSKEIFSVDERDSFDMLARLYRLDIDRMGRKRRLDHGILTRERKPPRRRRRAKKNPT
jgi:hypothetical protein